MKRCYLFLCVALLGLLSFNTSFATDLGPADLYGCGAVAYDSEHGNGYGLRWARLGAKGYVHSETLKADSLMVNLQYDVNSSTLILGYGQVNHEWKGGTASVLAGKHLLPVQYLYDGPSSLRLTRWPDALNSFSVVSPGAAIWYENGPLNLRVSNFGRDSRTGATLGFGALSAGWEEHVGFTTTFQGTYLSKRFVNVFVGATHYTEEGTDNVYFAQNYWQMTKSLRLYGQYDFGPELKEAWLTGFNWELGENCFVNLYYDTQEDGAVEAEVKVAF